MRGKEGEENHDRTKQRRQQTARSLCGRAVWPLALSQLLPLLLLWLLLSDDDRTEKNREKQVRVGLGRTVLLIGKTARISYLSRNAVTLFFLIRSELKLGML